MEGRQALPKAATALPSTTIRYFLIVGGALVMMGLLLAAPAFGCSAAARAGASPSSGPVGTEVLVWGRGFELNTPVEVRWGGSSGSLLATTVTDSNGEFRASVIVPAETVNTPGFYTTMPEHPEWAPGGATFRVETEDTNPEPVNPPGDPVNQPGDPANQPGDPVNQPGDPVNQPGDPVNQPGDPVNQPGDPVNQPGDPVNQPGDPVTAPTPPAGSVPQPPAVAAPPAAVDAAPAPRAPAPSTTATRPPSTTSTPVREAPVETAPERELVAVAAQADDPANRALLAGAGISAPEAPTVPAERPVLETTPWAGDDLAEHSPVDAGRSSTPWPFLPLFALAAGLLAASWAALATGVRERAKFKAKT